MHLLVDIGCIECGEDTRIVAAYNDEAAAKAAFVAEAVRLGIETPEKKDFGAGYFVGGQRYLTVMKCEAPI